MMDSFHFQAVVKEEESDLMTWPSHEVHDSLATFIDQNYVKEEERPTTTQGEDDALRSVFLAMKDNALPQTGIATFLCKVKVEPTMWSEDEHDCEQKSITEDYPLDAIVIKREIIEIDTAYDYSMENGVSKMKASEGEDQATEATDDHVINALSYSALVKSENGRPENICDTDISEEESLSSKDEDEEMGKQHEQCGRVIRKRQIVLEQCCQTDKAGQTCSLCRMFFHNSQTYLQHMWRAHTGEKPYTCKICEETFKQMSRLQRHEISHSNVRPFPCNLCHEKSFKRKTDLRKHIRSCHSNERPYSCDQCEKTFKMKYRLQKHKFLCHSNVRPYSCDLCDKTFKQKHVLKQHKETYHSNERPFSCDQCEKSFKQRGELQKHRASCHSNERPYSCDMCDKAFKRKFTLQSHKKARHSIERPYGV